MLLTLMILAFCVTGTPASPLPKPPKTPPRFPQLIHGDKQRLTTAPTGGGHPTTTNRTYWPTTGGAIAFQPGWFQGHATAFMYVNLGFGTDGPDGGPENMSFPMVSPIQILGPSKNPYPGTVCLPEVPLPTNTTVQAGDNATIQVVEIAVHGAALFSVSLFASPADGWNHSVERECVCVLCSRIYVLTVN